MAEEFERKDALKVQRPASALLSKAVDYKTYILANLTASYTSYMARNHLRSKKKDHASNSQKSWNGEDRLVVLNFLKSFRRACNEGGVHEGIGMILIHS